MAVLLIVQFDVVSNSGGRSARAHPLVVVLQAIEIRERPSVVVAPLIPVDRVQVSKLTPIVEVEGRRWSLIIFQLAAIPRAALKNPVGNLEADRRRIIGGLDFLFTGV